jgi:hypothetical protein
MLSGRRVAGTRDVGVITFATRSFARASGLLLLNISSFMGGVRPWRGAASASDGLLEVCCHYGALHLARMHAAGGGLRVAAVHGAAAAHQSD